MHRTQGDDYIFEGDHRRFEDRDLSAQPPKQGTIDTGEFNNAVQEEISYIIESVKGANYCNQTASADRTAGWHDLFDAIFDSEALTDDAISDLSVTKLTDGIISISDGGGGGWLQDAEHLRLTKVTGDVNEAGDYEYNALTLSYYDTSTTYAKSLYGTADEVRLTRTDSSGTNLARTHITSSGVKWSIGPGDNTEFKSANVMCGMFNYSHAGAWDSLGNGLYESTYTLLLTGVPANANVYSVTLYNIASGTEISKIYKTLSCELDDNGTTRRLTDLVIHDVAAAPTGTLIVKVEFDGSSLIGD